MNTVSYHLYIDASFSKQTQVAVAGFLLFSNDDDHRSSATCPPPRTMVFSEKNNIRAELRGVIFACEMLIERLDSRIAGGAAQASNINLYTDCQSVARLPARRVGLESSGFVGKKTGKVLSNADLYRQFFAVYDRLAPEIFWVTGHAPKSGRDIVHSNFSLIDKAVRKELRSVCRGSGG